MPECTSCHTDVGEDEAKTVKGYVCPKCGESMNNTFTGIILTTGVMVPYTSIEKIIDFWVKSEFLHGSSWETENDILLGLQHYDTDDSFDGVPHDLTIEEAEEIVEACRPIFTKLLTALRESYSKLYDVNIKALYEEAGSLPV